MHDKLSSWEVVELSEGGEEFDRHRKRKRKIGDEATEINKKQRKENSERGLRQEFWP